jgi:hypothetical protein
VLEGGWNAWGGIHEYWMYGVWIRELEFIGVWREVGMHGVSILSVKCIGVWIMVLEFMGVGWELEFMGIGVHGHYWMEVEMQKVLRKFWADLLRLPCSCALEFMGVEGGMHGWIYKCWMISVWIMGVGVHGSWSSWALEFMGVVVFVNVWIGSQSSWALEFMGIGVHGHYWREVEMHGWGWY